jgi:hypothetical protein
MKRILVSLFAGALLCEICVTQGAPFEVSESASRDMSGSTGQSGERPELNTSAIVSEAAAVSDKARAWWDCGV